jgi:hypothetical protein
MDHPDVIAGIDGETDGLADHPVIRQRLGPHRIHFEARGLDHARWCGCLVERPGAQAERGHRGHTGAGDYDRLQFLGHSHRLRQRLGVNFCTRLPSNVSPV